MLRLPVTKPTNPCYEIGKNGAKGALMGAAAASVMLLFLTKIQDDMCGEASCDGMRCQSAICQSKITIVKILAIPVLTIVGGALGTAYGIVNVIQKQKQT